MWSIVITAVTVVGSAIVTTICTLLIFRWKQNSLKIDKGNLTDVQQSERIIALEKRIGALEGVLREIRSEAERAHSGQDEYKNKVNVHRGILLGLMIQNPKLAALLEDDGDLL